MDYQFPRRLRYWQSNNLRHNFRYLFDKLVIDLLYSYYFVRFQLVVGLNAYSLPRSYFVNQLLFVIFLTRFAEFVVVLRVHFLFSLILLHSSAFYHWLLVRFGLFPHWLPFRFFGVVRCLLRQWRLVSFAFLLRSVWLDWLIFSVLVDFLFRV